MSILLAELLLCLDYKAYRNSVHGSRYVRSIVKVFSQHAKDEDVSSLLTKVGQCHLFFPAYAFVAQSFDFICM